MANKSVLFGGRQIKVANRSTFDKSHLHSLTSGVGTITPILKQLVLPSSGRINLSLHAELPPLATDAYLRTHLKVEAFFVPLRLCYGGVQSWFAGEEVYSPEEEEFVRAQLPFGFVPSFVDAQGQDPLYVDDGDTDDFFGPGSLCDYFGAKFLLDSEHDFHVDIPVDTAERIDPFNDHVALQGCRLNIFPFIAYQLCYHHYYRNKSIQRPLFAPTSADDGAASEMTMHAYNLPWVQYHNKIGVVLAANDATIDGTAPVKNYGDASSGDWFSDRLLDGGSLYKIRQRNYGDDYFTAARPQAQAGNPVSVQVDANGKFSIASLRLQNALQEFSELNNYATPDYVQANLARYGVSVSDGVVQKPVILGSADFPMFTKAIEQNAQTADASSRNPFSAAGMLGATAGRATANGSQFVCDFDVKEVGYIIVNATLVPEANYASGIARDMRIFVNVGDLTDLPCSALEHVGDEPIMAEELYSAALPNRSVFGYVQRYLWHKAGSPNLVSGLYRRGRSLGAFIPQRVFEETPEISSAFLQVRKTALDDVASVQSGVSNFGVMLDCAFNIHISEPLSESALPALADPAKEHGREVYLSNGGSKLA